ncbi:MAG: hypothetical protein K2L38_01730 [Dysosmobacter sp.]|nr:hypothetical protein [Dysosmobacter sp.]
MDAEDFYDVYAPENRDYLLSDPEEDEPAPESEPEPEPEPEPSEEEPSEPEPEAPEEVPSEPEPEEPASEPETPPAGETVDGGETMKDLIDAIGDLNETITGAVTQEPEELPEEGEGSGGGGGSVGGSEVLEPTVDLAPVVKLLERTNELLEQQGETLVTQHNDLLQLQANVDFVFLAVAALIGVVLGVAVGKVFHDLWRA